MDILTKIDLPEQRVSASERNEASFYANTIDYYIALACSINEDRLDIENKIRFLNNDIDQSDYERTLNPYNASDERFKRFPAIIRNYDIMKGIIRRYVSEYIKNTHEFIVKANNPDIALIRDMEIRKELMQLVEEQIAVAIQNAYQEFLETGEDPSNFNPKEAIDIEAFIKEFNENYIDDASAQAQELLNIVQDLTDDLLLYTQAYFEFVTFGEAYTYCEVKGNKLEKRIIKTIDAFPVQNDKMFAKDFDAFVERNKMTYQQILDEFGEYFSDTDLSLLRDNYGNMQSSLGSNNGYISWDVYSSMYDNICSKFSNKEKLSLKNNKYTLSRDSGNSIFDVWRVAYRGEVKKGIVSYINNIGLIDYKEVDETYLLNPSIGDLEIEWHWVPQVFKGVRIGSRNIALYPIKVEPIEYNRNGELPYNGLCELLPGLGRFSLIDILKPYQLLINILYYHREVAIAKNKINLLVIPKSLVGSSKEDIDTVLYRIAADGTFYADDEDDVTGQKLQAIRSVNMDIRTYISELTGLIESIKSDAREEVDMTAQRFGEIANSAGKGVTQEAINRGSMGSVIIEYIFDMMREKDYARDLDYTKFAWIDGLDTVYKDSDNNIKYFSLDSNLHSYSDYIIAAKLSVREREKLEELKSLAFSAGQNGDIRSAMATIFSDNLATIKKSIDKYENLKQEYELQLKQIDNENEQALHEFKLDEIRVKGEEDRLTEELKGQIQKDIKLIEADANLRSFSDDTTRTDVNIAKSNLEQAKTQLERDKLQLERDRLSSDNYNKQKDREIKLKDINNKNKTNKNK